ncbi:MAG: class I SAM-dependent methyltransferase [Planctomycetes bacterium]|nr:class I SAM-dependent methyltransferase [Planctomycetota bacterium]
MSGEPDGATSAPPEWWRSAFGCAYVWAYSHRNFAAAECEAAFAARAMRLAPGSLVLDAGCGAGRHTLALAESGCVVVGLDLSAELLLKASARCAAQPNGPRWVRGDVRALPFRDAAFDHVVSFFTSFAYFDDVGDRRHLAELRRVVRRRGAFLLDFLNAPRVVATLVPASRRTDGRWTLEETRSIRDGRVVKHVQVIDAGAVADRVVVARWSESVRLYERSELEAMLVAAGFTVRAVFGDLAGAPWNLEAPRLVLLAEAS